VRALCGDGEQKKKEGHQAKDPQETGNSASNQGKEEGTLLASRKKVAMAKTRGGRERSKLRE